MVPPIVHAVLALHTDQHPGADEQARWTGQEGLLAGRSQAFELEPDVHIKLRLGSEGTAKCL